MLLDSVCLESVGVCCLGSGTRLYKINVNFRSKIVFKRVYFAYGSALNSSVPSVFILLMSILMAIDSNADPFPTLY